MKKAFTHLLGILLHAFGLLTLFQCRLMMLNLFGIGGRESYYFLYLIASYRSPITPKYFANNWSPGGKNLIAYVSKRSLTMNFISLKRQLFYKHKHERITCPVDASVYLNLKYI
jgi:hypothetical protein